MAKEKRKLLEEHLEEYLGEKVAIIAARYQYRGVLSVVGERFVVLSDACAVEQSGRSRNATPQSEDRIPGDTLISLDAIEIFYQPTWVNAPLPN